MEKFPNYIQLFKKDCGPTCLKIISKYYKKHFDINFLITLCQTNKLGTSFNNLTKATEKLGYSAVGAQINLDELNKAPLPCILLSEDNHFNVLYKIKNKTYYISDPESGYLKLNSIEFRKRWLKKIDDDKPQGICLLLEPTCKFFEISNQKTQKNFNLDFIKYFLKPQKKILLQLFFGLIIGILTQLLLPFITQNIVDKGIVNKDISFIYLLLIAQLVLYSSYIIIEWMRSNILLYLGSKIRIHLMSNFIARLLNMPISFFDIRKTGDILIRLKDHNRIRKLVTSSSLHFLFSSFSILVFSIVLALYHLKLFLIFTIGTLFYFFWFSSFLRKRAHLDNQSFKLDGKDSNNVVEMVDSMHDIKLNNAQFKQRWKWENIQVKIFEVENKQLRIVNFQVLGSLIINEIKNILLTFFAAFLTLNGDLTLGMLLAVMFIIAQLNAPLNDVLVFIQEFQDAILSIRRLNNISNTYIENESNSLKPNSTINQVNSIRIENLNFQYPGYENYVLKNINLTIPNGSKTAIVGQSGSGKTTLMKLLLKYYTILEGNIYYGNVPINDIDSSSLWKISGVVLQDGKIINDTAVNNVCLSSDFIDSEKFYKSLEISNASFVFDLPMNEETLLGAQGVGISSGEKQRLLIARAVYKDPLYLFFDEATSSLDTENETEIVKNLEDFIKDKTSIVIAHRLSTVKNADQIIVLNNGEVVEIGKHDELLGYKSYYFNLIKNQLDLAR